VSGSSRKSKAAIGEGRNERGGAIVHVLSASARDARSLKFSKVRRVRVHCAFGLRDASASESGQRPNGGTGGYRSFVGFVPSRRLGVVVLTNSGAAGADDIGMHVLNRDLPLAPKPTPVAQRTAIELSPDVFARYVGRYPLAPPSCSK
jgi:hypothetical protein